MMKRLALISVVIFICFVTNAQNVVIVTSNSAITSISKKDLQELYKGNISQINGASASFLDHQRTAQIYVDFVKQYFNMTPDQMNEYWVQAKLDSGKRPPKFLPDSFLPKALLSIKGSFSYFYEGQVPAGLTVVKVAN